MHQTTPKKTFVLSLGGSLIIPTSGFDIQFLSNFNHFIRKKVSEGVRFFITCGGGATARNYIDAATGVIGDKLKDVDKDWLGIHSSRLNAHLMRTIFRDIAYIYLIKHYDMIDKKAIDYPVVITAGWKPGWSTDFCATLVAQDYDVKTLINLSNIDQVYDKDPNKHQDAKALEHMTWDEIIKINEDLLNGKDWIPVLSSPFDPIATKKAKEIDLKVIVANGKNIDNLDNIIEGKDFTGTVIENKK